LTLAYFGTSEFAAAVLRALAGSPHRPALVVTQPDRPRGRGRRTASPPVADAARELGIALLAPERAGDALDEVRAAGVEIVCVCAYGQLIREPLLSSFEMLNVHPSLLPRWRGAAPIERAIMAGDTETGVSIMRVTAGLDSGPVCVQVREPIRPDDSYGTLAGRLEESGSRALIGALDGPREFVEQDEAAVTYAEKIAPEDRLLDGALDVATLALRVRALHPHIGARTAGGLRVLVAAAANGGDAAPGSLAEQDGRLLLGASDGALELLEVQPPGGRPMAAGAYLRGHPL
jgi:methionyl-tRNA formyltransferase